MENKEWWDAASFLWNSRKLILYITGAVTVAAALLSLLLPSQYRSISSLLPETGERIAGSLSSVSDLASMAGLNIGGESDMSKQYPAIIVSDAVLLNVVLASYDDTNSSGTGNLLDFWGIEGDPMERRLENGLKILRRQLEIETDNKTGIVSVSIETSVPEVSAEIVNNTVRELDKFIRTKRNSRATEQRRWIEERLGDVEEDLKKSENKLREFKEKNRRTGDSPQLLLEERRLLRDIEINSTMYVELKKQFELIRIEEIRSTPVVSVLDVARPSVEKSSPKRRVIVLNFFFFSFLASIITVIIRYRYRPLIERVASMIQNKERARG